MAMIDKYLKIPVVYKEYLGNDSESINSTENQSQDDIFGVNESGYNSDYNNVGIYADERTIMCAMDKASKVVLNGTTMQTVTGVMYITKEKITPKSILNGHLITSVDVVYDFRGKIDHYESTML